MKKIYTILIWIGLASVATAQVDTFALYNMPRYYYVEDSLDYDQFTETRAYDKMRTIDGTGVWGGLCLSLGVRFCFGELAEHYFYGYRYWNVPNFDWFAVGAHADTSIRVAGVAMIYPRYKFESPDIHNIREEWISHGCDKMLLSLMDTAMGVQAEGKIMLADSVGKPVFVLNSIPNRREMNTDGGFPNPFDVYEAWFPDPVTVSDSFYLAFRLEDSVGGFHSVPFPGIYEHISYYYNVVGPLYYDFPAIHWKAHGRYMHAQDLYNHSINIDSVENPEWFTYRSCEENHGYMLIFPILAEDCGVHGEVTWALAEDSSVTLHWTPGSWDTQWEVCYGPSGTMPGDSTAIVTTVPSLVLQGIAADSHYVAYVRSKCTVRDTTWSDWTDSISIFVPTAPAPPIEDIASVEARAGVDLQPNPAAATALLTAAVPLTAVEVYTAAGTLYKRLPATGLSVSLDVSAWPSGTYLLLVSTEAGTVTRRLVVTH